MYVLIFSIPKFNNEVYKTASKPPRPCMGNLKTSGKNKYLRQNKQVQNVKSFSEDMNPKRLLLKYQLSISLALKYLKPGPKTIIQLSAWLHLNYFNSATWGFSVISLGHKLLCCQKRNSSEIKYRPTGNGTNSATS